MADKTAAELIAEHEAERQKLKDKQAAELLKAAPQYPKHIRVEAGPEDLNALTDVEGKRYIMIEVKSEEEERAAGKRGSKSKGEPVVVVNEDRKAAAKAEEERKEAAEAKAEAAKRGGKR